MHHIEGLCQRAVTSGLDFHYPKGASLDTVNVASPTPFVRLYISHECFSLCSRSYPLAIFETAREATFILATCLPSWTRCNGEG